MVNDYQDMYHGDTFMGNNGNKAARAAGVAKSLSGCSPLPPDEIEIMLGEDTRITDKWQHEPHGGYRRHAKKDSAKQ